MLEIMIAGVLLFIYALVVLFVFMYCANLDPSALCARAPNAFQDEEV